jgi:hypothetical protein
MEACSGAHYWTRELQKLGHEIRLIAAQFVHPFVKTLGMVRGYPLSPSTPPDLRFRIRRFK